MESEILQLSAVAIIFGLAIKEFFRYLMAKKNGGNGLERAVTTISENHLRHILDAINAQTDSNNRWHEKQYQALCEIKSKLDK